ncbi:chromosome segregation ATPase [Dethiosulfatibacter aminovorans DSM 17477]|uniref:Sporulation initiation inhibitor protein Soj n=1 Tax=Dethiosulfatibacter aminovorans DSM 17477 TaxID=1121476 RepID=A0A1M6AKM7_9FIRM|nr:AAA family ATPase [Dethiosulfatibacter aminovorans]SHI37016.1 chromosome segregation ATPase [Dethiosulfatibacter aminovorans DSM 17477]
MGKVISIFNQKGGVGKTTTNVNLSAILAMKGKRILSVDIDPQGNSTSGFGIDKNDVDSTIYDCLFSDIEESGESSAIVETDVENLHLIPSNIELAGAEIELTKTVHRENTLKNFLGKIREDYDFIFIDCPPSLGLLTINALTASDSVIIPIQCEYYALEGVSQLVNTVKLVKRNLNPKLDIEGIVLNMYDGRTNLSIQVVEEVKKYFKNKVYKSIIPRNVRLAEAPSFGQSIVEYDEKSKGAEAYTNLAEEFLGRI